jgi:O-antigen/teichoic acid export membrane protein
MIPTTLNQREKVLAADAVRRVPPVSALRSEILAVGKHSFIYAVGQALARGVGFLMIPVYTRYIAVGDYGAMQLIEILFGAFQIVISMGVAEVMSRFYYAEKDQAARNRLVSTIVINFGLMGVPIVLVFLALSPFLCSVVLEDPHYLRCVQIVVVTAWLGMLCEIGYTFLRMRYMAKSFVAITTLQLAAALGLNIYFLVFMKLDIIGIFYSTLITQGLTGVLLVAAILRHVGLSVSLRPLGQMLAFGLPLVPPQIVNLVGHTASAFFLRWLGAADPAAALVQVGLLSLGQKFGQIVDRFINVPFNAFWSPRRLELLLNDEPHAKQTVARMCTYSCALSIAVALFLASTITPVIMIMAKASYWGCQVVVPVLVLSQVAVALEMHFRTGIVYQRKTIWDTIITVPSIVTILAWNYVFVPRYGLMGAATANLAACIVRAGLAYFVSQQLYYLPFEIGRISQLLLSAAALYGLSQMIEFSSPWTTLAARTALVPLFPVALLVTGFYREGEREFLARFLATGFKWNR